MSSSALRKIIKARFLLSTEKNLVRGVVCQYSQEAPVETVQDVKNRLIEVMGIQRSYKPLPLSRSHLLEYLPKSQDELPVRKMKDSFSSVVIPLSTDITLQEKYVTFLGHVRLGRLMEDMDIFAAWVAHKHILNPRKPAGQPTPYVIVTVLVDQIDFTDITPKHDGDIRLSGHVSWVGKSSIEVTVWLEQLLHGSWQKLTRAVFLMAARNSILSGPAIVNLLEPETEEEKEIFRGGELRKKRRVKVQQESLFKMTPDVNEQRLIHDLFLKTIDLHRMSFHKRILPPRSLWMEDAQLSNIVFSHPEDRNLHNKVFGGFLMRQALELSWTAGYLHSKFRPRLCHISDISFHKPVDVGSLLRMNSLVTYTECNYVQITVYAEVFDPRGGQQNTTNVFHYTYEMPEEVPQIIPKSYQEAMMYLDGRRHFQHVMGLSDNTHSSTAT
ncbi:acyl-coenzyme A thioesterase 9, mitochondrial-like [Schistocerca americana]|uniref:acyl-coenzyme A thioesterase 9, mitochondrial-like n=1 Tax=Schistocerca americana TaxID=7009 RepID=UPI001F4F796A|nr:acyl-coenzyme A thioesterase 9, mitochondrial-like [Schistocerca americana]